MDLFEVDTWASDKNVDELNTQLFGAITGSTRTLSKRKVSHRDTNLTEKNEKKRNNKGRSRTINNGEEFKVKKKRKNKDSSTTEKGNQPSEIQGKVKKSKRPKPVSTKVEVIDTNCEGNGSTSFTDFLNTDPVDHGKGVGVLKKKCKSSSKRNKYKHLDEFRKTQREDANAMNANKSKVDIDLSAKLNSKVLVPHKFDKSQGNNNYENGEVASPSGTENQSKKKKTKNPQKNIETVPKIDNEKESFRSENTDHAKKKLNPKKRKQDSSGVDDLACPPNRKKSRTTEDSNEELIRAGVDSAGPPKKKKRRTTEESNKELVRDGVDLAGPPKKKKSRTTEDSNKELVRAIPKQKSVKKSSLNVSQLKEALKQQSPKIEKEPDTKAKDITKAKKSLSLRDRMMEQLNSARFRYINEQLYNVPGHEAFKMMQEDESAFEVYHKGFQQQVDKWPQNPMNKMIAYIKKRPDHVVADFGCGDAKIAQAVSNKVHSFDLVALNEYVTPCDMANVPLHDESIDIAVFCLSLMGTNLADFLAEAHRILKMGGNLLIAEVVSRFESIKKFTRKLERMGFTLLSEDSRNKMFVWFELKKTEKLQEKLPQLELAPCIYKKR